MIRALAIAMLLAPFAAAQPKPPKLMLDAVVSGADGTPIANLTAKDFELQQGGKPREIDRVTWVAGPRKIVVIADDLALTPARFGELCNQLRQFTTQLTREDQAAIVRTSSGSAYQEQLSTDRRLLQAQIDLIQPIAAGVSDSSAANALAQSIRWTNESLQRIAGRIVVVLMSDHARLALLHENAWQAQLAGAVYYAIDANAPALELISATGGLAVPDVAALFRALQGHYLIEIRPESNMERSIPAVLRLPGKVARLRWRAAFLPEFRADPAFSNLEGELRTHLTPRFTGFNKAAAEVEVIIHVDGRDLSSRRDLSGIHHGSASIQVVPYHDNAQLAIAQSTTARFDTDDATFEKLKKEGLNVRTHFLLPGAGAYQFRAAVVDGISGRSGAVAEFIQIPAADKGVLALSGVMLSDATSAEGRPDITYSPDATIRYSYLVFNAVSGPAKASKLRVRTRVSASGRSVTAGSPTEIDFPPAEPGPRQVAGKIALDRLSPGSYVLEVEVTDLLAEGGPRIATQYRTFEVRE